MSYIPTIGLEVHAELRTLTKMFCSCLNDPYASEANANICPVCMGHPGTLPVINKEAVRQVLRAGLAVAGTLADLTEFDRKNYFYPDIPKGYQISQYKYPLVAGGLLSGVALTRIHLEEDTASSTHEDPQESRVDFNRAGVPLMELVTEPVIHSAEEASAFARELRTLLRTLGASDANMERGEMRVEANISIAQAGEPFGTKVEVKNLNSFRSVERAIAFEVDRHTKLLEQGKAVAQETRGWDETKQQTFSQRSKEVAEEYRYFPDPDLPKLRLSHVPEFAPDTLRATLPELPWVARTRLVEALGIASHSAEVLVQNEALKRFFDATVESLTTDTTERARLAVNYLTSDLIGLAQEGVCELASIESRDPAEFAVLIDMIAESVVSSRGAKEVLRLWVVSGGDPRAIAKSNGYVQVSDPAALDPLIQEVIAEQPAAVKEYRAGKENALQFLVGQGMKRSRGAANPGMLRDRFIELLS